MTEEDAAKLAAGEKFKRLRKRKGFKTRSDLVAFLKNKITVDAVRKWETGKRRPNPLVIQLLRSL